MAWGDLEGEEWIVFLVLAVSLIPRLIMFSAMPSDLVAFPQGLTYMGFSEGLFAGEPSPSSTCTPPGYPLLITLGFLILGPGIQAARALTVFVGALNPVLTYLITRRFTGKKTALLSALFLTLHTLPLFWSTYILPQQTALLFSLAAVYMFLAASGDPKKLVFSSLFAAAGFLTETNVVAVWAVMLFALLCRRCKTRSLLAYTLPFLLILTYYTMYVGHDFLRLDLSTAGIKRINYVLAWSINHNRIGASAPIFLLAVFGLLMCREKLIHYLLAGVLVITPLFSYCGFTELNTYLLLTPYVAVLAGCGVSWIFKGRRWAAGLLLAVILFQVIHFMVNEVQEYRKFWEYQGLGVWAAHETGEGERIMSCGNEWRPGSYISQFCSRDIVGCVSGRGDASPYSFLIFENISYIIVDDVRLEYTADKGIGGFLEEIYYERVPAHAGVGFKLVYGGWPRETEVSNKEIFSSLAGLRLRDFAEHVKQDLTTKKHVYLRVYRIDRT